MNILVDYMNILELKKLKIKEIRYMYLVNEEYIEINEFGIFTEIVRASDKNDFKRVKFFEQLLQIVLNYKKKNKRNIETIYIRISDLKEPEMLKISEIPIERQVILNALLYAAFENDIDMIKEISSLSIGKNELLSNELGNTLNYILCHSIDMNEYLTNEKERIIYNERLKELETGYIYQSKENILSKKKILIDN